MAAGKNYRLFFGGGGKYCLHLLVTNVLAALRFSETSVTDHQQHRYETLKLIYGIIPVNNDGE